MQECPACGVCYDDGIEACGHEGSTLLAAFPGPPLLDDKYRIERRLAHGGMGVIYAARHVVLQRTVALKVVAHSVGADAEALQSFRREAEALGHLKHPNIVDVSDFGVDPRENGLAYLVMEYLEGSTLEEYCVRRRAVPVSEALPILESIARAVDFAHEQGFIHRDLKPSNVFLARDGGQSTVKVLDFGLARRNWEAAAEEPAPFWDSAASPMTIAEAPRIELRNAPVNEGEQPTVRITADQIARDLQPRDVQRDWMQRDTARARTAPATAVVGTLGFIAPELLGGGARGSRATDVYALGVLIYRLLVNDMPFAGNGMEYLAAQVTAEPIAPSTRRGGGPATELPPELDEPLLSLLARDPAKRPKSAMAAVAAIRAAWDRAAVRRWRTREMPRRILIAAAIAALFALAVPLLERLHAIRWLEGKTIDLRFASAPKRAPDGRIALLLFDEATLREQRATISERADDVGATLQKALDAGARGAAIDLLLPPRWSESRPFAELLLTHRHAVTLAAQTGPDGTIIGTEAAGGLIAVSLGAAAPALFGFAEMDVDADAATRFGRLAFQTRDGGRWPSFAARAATTLTGVAPSDVRERFLLDGSIDVTRIRSYSWKDVDRILESDPARLRGKLLVVGGAFVGSGDELHRTPLGTISGPMLQAVAIDTIVAGFPYRAAATAPVIAFVFAIATAVAYVLLTRRRLRVAIVVLLFGSLLTVSASVAVFRTVRRITPVAAPLVSIMAAFITSGVVRRQLGEFPASEAVS
jgi:serine/threonine protein kinase